MQRERNERRRRIARFGLVMGDNWLRIERALSQQMSYEKKMVTNLTRFYTVKGSSGILYDVSIGQKTSCSCPDFTNNRNRCKHQILCLLADFNIGIHNDILHSTSLRISLQDLEDSNPVAMEGDECPICFDVINRIYNSHTCKQCHKSFHKLCIERWVCLSTLSGGSSTCPMCRAEICIFP